MRFAIFGGVAASFLAAWLAAASAEAQEEEAEVEPYARVIVDRSVIRSGPGSSFNRVYVAERGEVFPILQRSTRGGFWFQVRLPDATTGYILGDTVYVHVVSDEEAGRGRILPKIFAPPPLPTARASRSFGAGSAGYCCVAGLSTCSHRCNSRTISSLLGIDRSPAEVA